MMLLRRMLGDVLRRHRVRQSRTLRDVAAAAGVSLGYLSEVERGRKEASSELLAAICAALDVSLAEVLREVSEDLAREERRVRMAPVGFTRQVPAALATRPASGRPAPAPMRPVAGVPPMRPLTPAGPGRAVPRRPGTPVASLSSLSWRAQVGPVTSLQAPVVPAA